MTTAPDTEATSEEDQGAEQAGSWKTSVIISAVILAAAGGLAALTFFTEPEAQKGGATKKTAMLVDVVEMERGTYHPTIVATGTVEPDKEVILRPQVEGRVVSIAADFTPGGYVEKGEVLVRLEAADYRNELAQRKSELQEAIKELAVEGGRQDAARADYEYLGEDLPEDNQELVLRKPQLEAAKRRVEAARSAVEQARLNIRRTTIEAPFDAHVLRRDVNEGSRVSPNDSLGRLVGMDIYWVAVELPLPKLRWISIPNTDDVEKGSPVQLRNRASWPEDTYREGRLYKLVGALDEKTRMARVLVAVSDPLARETDEPPLMVGEFLETRIEGEELQDVVRLNRDYVREDDTVWVMDEGKLAVRDVEIPVRDAKYAYVTEGLDDGDEVVTTNLSTVVEGAPLRLNGESAQGKADAGTTDE